MRLEAGAGPALATERRVARGRARVANFMVPVNEMAEWMLKVGDCGDLSECLLTTRQS